VSSFQVEVPEADQVGQAPSPSISGSTFCCQSLSSEGPRSQVGSRTNIGAGTITCNFNGASKNTTVIGDNAFVGSNSTLVAPLQIGSGAIVAAGSTITGDVPEDAVSFGRARQVVKEGQAQALKAKLKSRAQ